METRANQVWVGAVTLLLLAMMAAAIIWIARLSDVDQHEYDIFFKQSVDGLAKGSKVSFAGVPVGQVKDIELWKKDPSFVRVRISVEDEVPVLVGTTATIQGSFTGVSDIQLEGAVKGAPPITEPGPEGVPVIPTRAGGLGAILNSAPLLMERLATLTERLNVLLGDQNQDSIRGILANSEKLSGSLADASPQLKQTMTELQNTLKQTRSTLASFDQVAGSANKLMGSDGQALAGEMRNTLQAATKAADELSAAVNSARPATQQLSETTLPAAEATLRELRATSRSLRNLTEKIEEQGASAIVGGPKLPDYKP